MELFTLAVPEVVPAVSNIAWRLVKLDLDWEAAEIVIGLKGSNGERRSFTYGGIYGATDADRTKATALMVALNKANLSIKSLQRRVLEQLVADGLLAGAITGAPD